MEKISSREVKEIFHQKLKKEVHLVWNNNKYQWIKILAVESQKMKISLHHIFRYSGKMLIKKIAQKISQHKGCEETTITLKQSRPRSTPSQKYTTTGIHYDLLQIYQNINQRYFDNRVDLTITWFGNAQRKAKWHRTLGYYDGERKVIKVHRLLDDPFFPPFYLDFIVYHEMLHHVYPPFYSKSGRYLTHHKRFKEQEKNFQEYAVALNWEKKNMNAFFN